MNWDAWLKSHYRKHPPKPQNGLNAISEVLGRGYLEAIYANLQKPGAFAMFLISHTPEPKLTFRNGEVDWDFFLTRFYLKHPPRPRSDGPLKRNSQLRTFLGPEIVVGNARAVG